MKIKIQPPRPCEARVSVNNQGEVSVTPVFSTEKSRKTFAYVTVSGESGRERLFTLDISGHTGKITVQEIVEVVPHFDTAPQDSVLGEDDGDTTAETKP